MYIIHCIASYIVSLKSPEINPNGSFQLVISVPITANIDAFMAIFAILS